MPATSSLVAKGCAEAVPANGRVSPASVSTAAMSARMARRPLVAAMETQLLIRHPWCGGPRGRNNGAKPLSEGGNPQALVGRGCAAGGEFR